MSHNDLVLSHSALLLFLDRVGVFRLNIIQFPFLFIFLRYLPLLSPLLRYPHPLILFLLLLGLLFLQLLQIGAIFFIRGGVKGPVAVERRQRLFAVVDEKLVEGVKIGQVVGLLKSVENEGPSTVVVVGGFWLLGRR